MDLPPPVILSSLPDLYTWHPFHRSLLDIKHTTGSDNVDGWIILNSLRWVVGVNCPTCFWLQCWCRCLSKHIVWYCSLYQPTNGKCQYTERQYIQALYTFSSHHSIHQGVCSGIPFTSAKILPLASNVSLLEEKGLQLLRSPHTFFFTWPVLFIWSSTKTEWQTGPVWCLGASTHLHGAGFVQHLANGEVDGHTWHKLILSTDKLTP